MQVKKFQAESMPEALKMVKAEFGLDAMILNSREERRKGILGFFRKPYVEVTAAIGRPAAGRNQGDTQHEAAPANTREEFRNAMLEPLVREIKQLKDKVEILFEKESDSAKNSRRLLVDSRGESERGACPEAAEAEKPEGFEKVQWRTGDIQADFPVRTPDLLKLQSEGKSAKDKQTALGAFADSLRQNGVDTEIVGTLLKKIAPLIGRKRKSAEIGKWLGQVLESLVDFTGEAKTGNDERRVIALFGPTGVGKTTTIAKMAASAAEEGKKVAIISTDALKPGDVEQLKRYACSDEISLDSAITQQKLVKAIKNHRGKDILLIDTAGVSPNDQEGMEHLQKLLTASPGIEKHLCLSSTTRDRELDETIRRFAGHSIDRLIFTRLDESATFGSIINVLLRSNLPPSFLTTGQQVSGDIEIATAGRLADLVMGVN
jgi:flagellar biosynthesis protein FlhF